MKTEVKGIPEGYHTLTPYLIMKDATKAIKFYKEAFGAQEIKKHPSPDGRIMYAVIQIGDSLLMLSDEFSESGCGASAPSTLNGTTAMLHVYVENVDALFNQAVKAGGKVKMPVSNTFWGDRYGMLEDPFGHIWSLATRIAHVEPEQIEQGAKQCFSATAKRS